MTSLHCHVVPTFDSSSAVKIEEVLAVTPSLVEAWERLLPQLSRSSPPVTAEALEEIVSNASTVMFAAMEDGSYLGFLTLVTFRIPTGLRAWIEDVVVDEGARGKGVGEALTRAALDAAQARGARTVELTSRASREAANRLYQRVGFQIRETNVYRYSSEEPRG
jgi:ribosomal protein S18 acetylase RimI-like enzyme